MSDEDNLVEKVFLAYAKGMIKLIDTVDEKFDIDILKKMGELEDRNTKFQKEHPVLNVGKQLLKGTVKGLLGSSFHHK